MGSHGKDSTVETGTTSPDEGGKARPRTPSVRARGALGSQGTVAERLARGKAARLEVPRRTLGDWEPSAQRPDPVDLLEEQARTRLPDLVPIRYGRMLGSPLTFYRGAAYLMASDLAHSPRTGLHTQLCGDAHLSNFGGFAAPDRKLVFSINDFDETLPGPFEWDVRRLVASFTVLGRERGFDKEQRMSIAVELGRSYRESIRRFSSMHNIEIWYSRIEIEEILASIHREATTADAKWEKRLEANIAKGQAKDSVKAFSKLTTMVDGEPRITGDPPLIVPIEDIAGGDAELYHTVLRHVLTSYQKTLAGDRRKLLERYRYVHAARKVVGVGSVGTRAWICLLLGRDEGDPLFLQFKEAQPSVLEGFLGRSEYKNCGRRVVEGQRLTQAASDIMLGWIRISGFDGVQRDFYIRQLWDSKISADVEELQVRGTTKYAQICAEELARAHARAGDGIAIASYLGVSDTFDQAMARFGEAYADQNERDYASLKSAVESGRVAAEFGM